MNEQLLKEYTEKTYQKLRMSWDLRDSLNMQSLMLQLLVEIRDELRKKNAT